MPELFPLSTTAEWEIGAGDLETFAVRSLHAVDPEALQSPPDLADWDTVRPPASAALQPDYATITVTSWLSSALDSLREIAEERGNWDKYGAPAIDLPTAFAALTFLHFVATRRGRPPVIVPTGRGHIQLEWRSGALGVDVVVGPGNEYYAALLDRDGRVSTDWCGDLREGVLPELARAIAYVGQEPVLT